LLPQPPFVVSGLAPSREELTKELAEDTTRFKVVLGENFLLSDAVFAKFFNIWKDFDFGRRVNCLGKVDQIDMGSHYKLLVPPVSRKAQIKVRPHLTTTGQCLWDILYAQPCTKSLPSPYIVFVRSIDLVELVYHRRLKLLLMLCQDSIRPAIRPCESSELSGGCFRFVVVKLRELSEERSDWAEWCNS